MSGPVIRRIYAGGGNAKNVQYSKEWKETKDQERRRRVIKITIIIGKTTNIMITRTHTVIITNLYCNISPSP